jgi:hypothetical protein
MNSMKQLLSNYWRKSLIIIATLIIVYLAGYHVGGSIGELIFNLTH